MTHDDHSVRLRSVRERPEKCCAGVAVKRRAPPGRVKSSHQSSSTMRFGCTPMASRRAPTPSDVMTGTPSLAICRMLLAHKWS